MFSGVTNSGTATTATSPLPSQAAVWCDLDNDGRLDIIAGNWGLNSPYVATLEHPVRIYFGEWHRTGALDSLEAYDEPALGIVPRRFLDEVARALPSVREQFPTHTAYAKATISDILGDRMAQTRELRANTLASLVFFNRGDRFEELENVAAQRLRNLRHGTCSCVLARIPRANTVIEYSPAFTVSPNTAVYVFRLLLEAVPVSGSKTHTSAKNPSRR